MVVMEQDPKGLLQPMTRVLCLSAAKAIGSEMPSCVKSFILPIAYVMAVIGDANLKLQILCGLFDK